MNDLLMLRDAMMPDDEFVPGKYADDARVGFLMISGSLAMLSIVVAALDGWQETCFYLGAAIYFALLYILLEDR